jgi:hypothetical protein
VAKFELIFAVDKLDDDTVWSIYEKCDALIATHGSLTLLTVMSEGATALRAAKMIVQGLERVPNVKVKRCYEDLVSRVDIAERAATTPQAVGQWIRGERHRDHPFPEPFNLVSGGVWLWGEVNQWFRRTGKKSDNLQFPCKEDYAEINQWLNERRAQLQIRSATKASQWVRGAEITHVRLARTQSGRSFDWHASTEANLSEMAD